jgi:hypothetical protein
VTLLSVMPTFYIALPDDDADRLRELAWRERRSPRQQAAVLVLAALDRLEADAQRAARPGRRTRLRPSAGAPGVRRARITWTADGDGQAHAAISRRLRTPCGRRPLDPRFGWPETQPRCAVCLAGVEEVLSAKRR